MQQKKLGSNKIEKEIFNMLHSGLQTNMLIKQIIDCLMLLIEPSFLDPLYPKVSWLRLDGLHTQAPRSISPMP